MSGSNEPQVPQVPDTEGTSIDVWMSALAASSSPPPRIVSTAVVLRRARLEARLAVQRTQTRRALRPALMAEAVGAIGAATIGVHLCTSSGDPGLPGLGDLGLASIPGLGSSSAVIALLVTLLLVLWFVGDEPATAG